MSIFAGLDVSDKTTHICVVDGDGVVLCRDVVATDPDVLAKWLGKHCKGLVRVVLETGPLSTFLYHGRIERDTPAICICAHHAKKALSARINKSDVNDAESLAQLCRTGWFKAVHMKAGATHIDRAALKIRGQLVTSRNAMANQLRGMLKLFGLRMGMVTTPGKRRERLGALFSQRPDLRPVFTPLIESIEALEVQIAKTGKLLSTRASSDPICTRLMSVPGVGPMTALAFKASVEDPGRFARSSEVGAYAGLIPRRNQSGERDYKGHITKAGDAMLRHALYEAANSILARLKRPCALADWGKRLADTKGPKRARVAVARKLAVLLHKLWLSETEFCWNSPQQYEEPNARTGRSRLLCRWPKQQGHSVGDIETSTLYRLTAITRQRQTMLQSRPLTSKTIIGDRAKTMMKAQRCEYQLDNTILVD